MGFQNKKTKENNGERYSRWYFEELKKAGYVEKIEREPQSIEVLPPFLHKKEKHFKSKKNESENIVLLKSVNYTYDFKIIWTEKALNLFTEIYNKEKPFIFGKPFFVSHYIKINEIVKIVSYIDVKPHVSASQFSGSLSTYYTFPYVQKILMATRGLFINKMIPTNNGNNGVRTCMFAVTFVPNRFLFTDTGQQLRKIKIKKTTLSNFINQREKIIKDLLEKSNKDKFQRKLL